ncbi:MAG: TrpR-like protein YerC/YecD [Candidatus Pacebacteria bacterium GW2011_GWA1_46_10]|nr:MAG: TrpR-like protein YerC/YecD [Candidatus Pacebacteria bacterium GW2011_GWA1_46_10]HCR80878.1 transcriptional regulator [Candidatus Paceibacterota bacterium]
MPKYPSKQDKELVNALTKLKSEREIAGFLRDLLTPAEIEEFSRRFQIAKLLWTTEKSYLEIAKEVGTSTTTVTRVAQWLYRESWQGYSTVLERMYGKSKR